MLGLKWSNLGPEVDKDPAGYKDMGIIGTALATLIVPYHDTYPLWSINQTA